MKHPRMFTSYVMGLLGLLCAVSQPAFSQDPLKVAPGMYKLLFENERVRVMEVTLQARRVDRTTFASRSYPLRNHGWKADHHRWRKDE